MKLKYDENGIPKIGGWLYIVAANIIGSIIHAAYSVMSNYSSLDNENLSFMFNEIKLELAIHGMLFIYLIYIGYLFISRRSNFSKHFIIAQIAAIVYSFIAIYLLRDLFITMNINYDFGNATRKTFSTCIGTFIVMLYVIKSKRVEQTFIIGGGNAQGNTTQNERKCPYCAEWIKSEAVVCRFCGRDVKPEKPEGIDLSKPTDSVRRP